MSSGAGERAGYGATPAFRASVGGPSNGLGQGEEQNGYQSLQVPGQPYMS